MDATSVSSGIGSGIETFPVLDYVLQSVFLKMTGAQEQKLKCICWELATNDYEYRYHRFTKKQLGECSHYSEKKEIYKDLIIQIKKHNSSFSVLSLEERNKLLKELNNSIVAIFFESNLKTLAQKKFNDYQAIWSNISNVHFACDSNNLFSDKNSYSLKAYMKIIYIDSETV
ncbi:hypothetical protein [Geofilum rubicundum]|uniref:hypothetical protein n=1 Tax=Geofilum rubicundum TaxID=472113 RepID=UPI001D0E4E47|nr:hypothetical protein [Geofilum rubicundum]